MKKLLLVLGILVLGTGITMGATVTFNVNMGFQMTLGNFDPANDFVDVAGSLNGWGGSEHFTDADGDSVYTLTVDSVAVGAIEYKFRINGDWATAEGDPNRTFDVVAGDNVIPTDWYNRQEPVAATNVEVLLQVDMTVQLLNGNFQPDSGDIVVVRGAPAQYGGWGGAVELSLDPSQSNVYIIINQFDDMPVGTPVEYKFVILQGGDVNAAVWEGSPNRSWTPTGSEEDTDSNGYGEILQAPVYFADVTPDDIITQDVTVTFSVDISSAYRALAAGDTLIDTQTGSDGIGAWSEVNGVNINGLLSQWWDWGNDLESTGDWAMTQTDNEGLKYSFDYLFTAGQAKVQEYKYGINSLDNEAGFAENRSVTIDDSTSTYIAPEDCFGSQNTDENLPFPQDCGSLFPTVTFNVNMGFQMTLGNFDPANDFVDVAGSLNGWGGSEHFTDADGDSVYTLTVDSVAVGAIEYKFRINGDWATAEGDPNRTFDVVAGDNVIPTDWYNRQEPVAATNVEVLLQVDMTVQLLNGNFQPDSGDIVVVRGAPAQYGGWGGAVELSLDPSQSNVYIIINQFDDMPVGTPVEYKFVILQGGDVNAAVWEGSPNRSWTPTGSEEDTDSNGYGEILQAPVYFADVTPDDIITQDVTVTFSVDISSAYRALAAGDTLIDTQTGSDGIGAWSEVTGISINGLLSQWWDWGNDLESTGDWAMTQTDTSGFKYSFDYLFTAGQAKEQGYKYGINSLDNEAGFGENRSVIIDDAAATYIAPEDCFGSQNTDENVPFPQLCAPLAIEEMPGIPTDYSLEQNYPNPFNPATTISFSVPEAGLVRLAVYNVLGQEVKTLVNSARNAGNYRVTWDATNEHGEKVNSGLYIYRLQAGNKVLSNKMVLMK